MFVTDASGLRLFGRGDEPCDQTYATKIERKGEVCQDLSSAHLKNPTCALSEALRRVDMWGDAGSSAGGSRR